MSGLPTTRPMTRSIPSEPLRHRTEKREMEPLSSLRLDAPLFSTGVPNSMHSRNTRNTSGMAMI